MKPIISNLLVVEGKRDKDKILSIFDVNVFYLNGYNLDDNAISFLSKANKIHNIILLTDPDKAGEAIRKKINEKINDVINVYVPIEKCNNHQKHGVAECDKIVLYESLKKYVNKTRFNYWNRQNINDIKYDSKKYVELRKNPTKSELICYFNALEVNEDQL